MTRQQDMLNIKAPGLRRGDMIGVVAPAGPVDRARLERALARFHAIGFRTRTYADVFRGGDYLASDDDTRARELIAAFTDPETTGVWCARGGYGVVRLLERIDFDALRQQPKVFVGFSDISALHAAIQNRVGLVTIHAPNLQDGFGAEAEMSPATASALWSAVLAEKQSAAGDGYAFDLSGPLAAELEPLAGGKARGRLTGGNLAVVCGTIGTPYEMDTAGRILFVEDVGEPLYRIDRFLAQLALAGKLRAAAGILTGSFSGDDEPAPGFDAAVRQLLRDYTAPLGIPVLAGFPAGHRRENLALPINALVEVDADARRVRVCENPVAARP